MGQMAGNLMMEGEELQTYLIEQSKKRKLKPCEYSITRKQAMEEIKKEREKTHYEVTKNEIRGCEKDKTDKRRKNS